MYFYETEWTVLPKEAEEVSSSPAKKKKPMGGQRSLLSMGFSRKTEKDFVPTAEQLQIIKHK